MATPKRQGDKTPALAPLAPLAPTSEEIAQRAYEIFLGRGGEPGHDFDDWLQAESELLRENAARSPIRGN